MTASQASAASLSAALEVLSRFVTAALQPALRSPSEQEILRLMMELTVQDGPYSAIAEELNRRGYRTRRGEPWTPISVFQMLPRLVEVGPKVFASREWQQRKSHPINLRQ